MVDVKTWLAKQLSGNIILAVVYMISAALNHFWGYLEYLSTISLSSAQETELENMGLLMGYPRPLLPSEVILEQLFRFTSYLVAPTFSETGFSAIDGSVSGGNFSVENVVVTSNKMPLTQYRKALIGIARLKWNKFSLRSIDEVCSVFHSTYTIEYLSNDDILIVYTDITFINLYLAQMVFEKMFDTMPRIQVVMV